MRLAISEQPRFVLSAIDTAERLSHDTMLHMSSQITEKQIVEVTVSYADHESRR